jgi:hypothetical protein
MNRKFVQITMTITDKPIEYMIICSNRDKRPERFQRIKETEIAADNKNGAAKTQMSFSNANLNGHTFQANGKNPETIPDSPAMVSNHCIGERFILFSITTSIIA